ncbi:MAG TPA: hypothetical protein VFQ58_04510 [Flavisolibacter sp.]|jgi:hypothetical protein|nr:hypothetical protein [Flavisolibacter sp.]
MTEILNLGQEINLTGKSGTSYHGRILDKSGTTISTSRAIVCLANSYYSNGQWQHKIKDIYNADNESEAVEEFKKRDDVTHLILIPRTINERERFDKIQDLIQQYIHQ